MALNDLETPQDQESYIRASAASRNIDPNTAVAVAKSEGLGRNYTGDSGSSFGPFQLHVGGIASGGNAVAGMGDDFKKQTGLDPSDPSTVRQQIDFALDHAAKNGWAAWHGFKGDPMTGIAGDVTPKLPSVFQSAAQARAGGYSWNDIDSYLTNARAQAHAGGYSDAEINSYLGLPAPKDMATARSQMLQKGYKPEEVDGFIKALSATATPTAGDVLKAHGWDTQSAVQFFGQKFVNGVQSILDKHNGQPKTQEEQEQLDRDIAFGFSASAGDPTMGEAEKAAAGRIGEAFSEGFNRPLATKDIKGPMGVLMRSMEAWAVNVPSGFYNGGSQAIGEVIGRSTGDEPGGQRFARDLKAAPEAFMGMLGLGGVHPETAPLAKPLPGLPTVKDALDAATSVTRVRYAGEFPETYGRRVYHGTNSGNIEGFDAARMDPEALYGPGIYTTEDASVASQYAKGKPTSGYNDTVHDLPTLEKYYRPGSIIQSEYGPEKVISLNPKGRYGGFEVTVNRIDSEGKATEEPRTHSTNPYRRNVDRTLQARGEMPESAGPNVLPLQINVRNPLDMEAPVAKEQVGKVLDAMVDARTLSASERERIAAKTYDKGKDFYEAIRKETAEDGYSDKAAINAALEKAGYDGITHTGGSVTGGKSHRVWIAFHPEQLTPSFKEVAGGSDLNAAFQAIGKHYLETGEHPLDAAARAQNDNSLAAKLAGKFLGDESGSLRLGPEAPQFPYPREAPELPINVTSIQNKNPQLSNGIIDAFRKAFSPYNRGQEAADTAAILREGLARVARNYQAASYTLRDFGRSVGELTPAQKMDYIHAFETGEVPGLFKGTPLGDLATEMHKSFDALHDAMQKRGIVDSYIENYLPHLWRDPVAAGRFYSQRTMAGARAFTKERFYATYREGMENGLVPLSTNPIEIALTGIHQMNRAIQAHDMMTEIVDRGLARAVPYGERLGAGEIPIDDRVVRPRVAGQEGNRYVAPQPVATIINRAFSPGLGNNSIYQIARSAGNMMNSAQLGVSGFHLGFVTADAYTSNVAKGVKQISRFTPGEIAQGVKSIVTAPAAPFRNLIAGWKVWNQALGLKDYGPEVQSIADALVAGGGRIGMERQYAGSSAYGSFFNAFRGEAQKAAGEANGAMTIRQELASMMSDARASATTFIPAQVRFVGAVVPRIMDTIMAPLMEYYVPAMKAGVFSDLMRDELRINPTMDKMTLRQTAGRVWNSVDNRLGQFVYDNLFWDKMQKDLGHIGVRSLGWNLGTIRELAGGMMQAAQGRKITAGEFHQIADATSYVIALPIATAMMGATWGMLHGTFNKDWGIKDYLFPPTGGKADKRGDPERASMPGYMKDAVEWTTHPVDTAKSKIHPLLSEIWNMMYNQQWNDAVITDPRPGRESLGGNVADYAKYIAQQFEPITLKQQLQPDSAIGRWENWFGIKAAPHVVRQELGEKPTEFEQRNLEQRVRLKKKMDSQ